MDALRASIDARGSKSAALKERKAPKRAAAAILVAQIRSSMRCMPTARRTSSGFSDCRLRPYAP
jgi:hypothetical protein